MNPFGQESCLFFEEALLKKLYFQDYLGSFDKAEAALKEMKAVSGLETTDDSQMIKIHLLVDKSDGIIADVRFQVFGKSMFYIVLETLADLILLKSYVFASKVSSAVIENKLKKDLKQSLPRAFDKVINHVLFALDEALRDCQDIPVDEKELVTPIESEGEKIEIPNWLALELKQQLNILESVIAEDIRPYIELDEGGIEIVSLKEGIFLTIGYKGACTTCHSSTGSTLNAIQQILRNKVFPAIVVIPDSSWLSRDHE